MICRENNSVYLDEICSNLHCLPTMMHMFLSVANFPFKFCYVVRVCCLWAQEITFMILGQRFFPDEANYFYFRPFPYHSLILGTKDMRNSFNLLLIALAFFDSCYLFGSILESMRKSFQVKSQPKPKRAIRVRA